MRSTRPTSRRLDHTLVELPGQRSVAALDEDARGSRELFLYLVLAAAPAFGLDVLLQ